MTVRLYYDDCYLNAFTAEVVEQSDGGRRIYLDRSAFYPTSGGQPDDRGLIAGVPVLAVEDEGQRIAHLLATPLLATPLEPAPVSCEIDWRRRYDHMQQHTGQHLLSAVCQQLFGFPTLSFQMGAEVSSIELGTNELDQAQSAAIEDRCNDLARAGLPVQISYQHAAEAENLRKASSRAGELRIIAIAGIDRSACGGTHVRSTAEVAPLQIRRQERVRGNIRIEFVCGSRAFERMRNDYRIVTELARQTTCAVDELPSHITQLRSRAAETAKERAKLAAELARLEGRELYRGATPDAVGLRRALVRVDVIDDALRWRLQAFVSQGKAIALALGPAALIQCSPDCGFNAGAVLRETLAKFGGRGGGSTTSAQGSLATTEAAAELARALGFPN